MQSRTRNHGFTIVELIVSIALVLILMLGVSTVFKTISSTVAAGSSVSENTRVARAAQSVLSQDFGAYVNDAPCLLIRCNTQPAFRNRADELADRDWNNGAPTDAQKLSIDIDGSNTEGDTTVPGEVVLPATYNYRNHRTDMLSFFKRGLFKRQTGGTVASNGAEPFVSNMTATESWVWFGHLRLPDNVGNFGTLTDPGAGTLSVNPNNFYSAQWILGREEMLLVDKSPDTGTGTISDSSGTSQLFIDRSWQYDDAPNTVLSPIAYQAQQNGAGTYQIQQSRFDLAAVSIQGFKERLAKVINANDTTPAGNYDWYQRLFLSTGRRFQTNPFLFKPLTPAALSQQAPVFIPGCTQFIVEYAGDFLTQDVNTGAITDACYDTTGDGLDAQLPTDGQMDYVFVAGVGGAPPTREIRWYGMPRDMSGDGQITAAIGSKDIVPLRDFWQMVARESTSQAPWEKNMVAAMPKRPNYLAVAGGMASADSYTCT